MVPEEIPTLYPKSRDAIASKNMLFKCALTTYVHKLEINVLGTSPSRPCQPSKNSETNSDLKKMKKNALTISFSCCKLS